MLVKMLDSYTHTHQQSRSFSGEIMLDLIYNFVTCVWPPVQSYTSRLIEHLSDTASQSRKP